jgi:hypothetical protein
MEGFSLIALIAIGFIVFMASVYILRWVLGIDKIVELQREQTKLLREINNKLKV